MFLTVTRSFDQPNRSINVFNLIGKTCFHCKDRLNYNKKKNTTPIAVAA